MASWINASRSVIPAGIANSELGQQILKGQMSLADLAKYAQEHNLSPVHQSGRQEQLENLVNHYLFDK